ncbi:MAG: hypothetical protein J6L99_01025 [Ruminococcus sp.]|nr:hypothetical protein [Ruminococcus sp.]
MNSALYSTLRCAGAGNIVILIFGIVGAKCALMPDTLQYLTGAEDTIHDLRRSFLCADCRSISIN